MRTRMLLAMGALLLLTACEAEIPTTQTVQRGGLLFRIGDEEPYTGYVTGQSREDYRTVRCRFRKHYRNGRLDGESCFWYPGGKVESIEPYRNGEINGVVTRYYPDGKIKCRLHLDGGERGGRHGEAFWLPNGAQETRANLKDFLSG